MNSVPTFPNASSPHGCLFLRLIDLRIPHRIATWIQLRNQICWRRVPKCPNSSCPPAVADCHTSLMTPWSSSADALVPAGFLQETSTTNRQRQIEPGREDLQRHTLADTRAAEQQATPSNVFNYRTNQMVQSLSPSAATNLLH